MADEYDENHPDVQADFDEYGYSRPALFNKMSNGITVEQAQAAKEQVEAIMADTGLRSLVSIMEMGHRLHIDVKVEDFLDQQDAPPEYVDDVYVSISRVNSLSALLGFDKFDESHENTPEMREVFNAVGYVRPIYYGLADPRITEEQAQAAMEKLSDFMEASGINHQVGTVHIGDRHFLTVRIEDRIEKAEAPATYIDGVYVAIERVQSLNPVFDHRPVQPAPDRNNGLN